jgi:hypothetical protein
MSSDLSTESNKGAEVEHVEVEKAYNPHDSVTHKHESLRAHVRPYDDHEDHEHEPPVMEPDS